MSTWGKLLKRLARLAAVIAFALLFAGSHAAAQTTTYASSTDGALDENQTCSDPLVRTFTVGANFTVSDVDIAVQANHSRRGGLRMTLQSPTGTRVQIVDGNDPAVTGSNFNVRLNDQGTQIVNTDGNSANHSTTAPPFQHNFIPNNSLAAFAGESSAGTWRLEICNAGFWFLWWYTGGTGTFRHAELYLTAAPNNYADLSLRKSVGSGSGNSIQYSLTVENSSSSPATATGVTVTDLLPAGVSYTSHTGGTYNPGTGLWNVGTLAPGQSRTLTINAAVTAPAGTTITNTAQVSASSLPDLDSTPGNSVALEDDQDSASFTVGSRLAGIAPVLSCPKTTILFDWDSRSWSMGSTSASYAVAGMGNVSFAISNPGAWRNTFGGTNPIRTADVTGGHTPAQYSLAQTVDLANRSQVATTTITLPIPVDGLQFQIFDVDYGANQFADRVRVTGSFGGSPVVPVLTNGTANYVVGNEAFGDVLSGDTESAGNVTVTFQSTVDTIVIEYGNHSLAPANPGQQAITLHDITFCEPHANILVTKVSSVLSDPVRGTTNPVAIPRALVSYCILITNDGSAPASALVANDTLPATMTYVPGSLRSGSACGSTPTIEDDNATGSDESDPVGASISGNQLTISAPSLGGFETLAVAFNATID